jgi:hypothetical protein
MDLSDLDFGTVPAAASAIVAFLTLVLAYATYRANLGRRRRKHDARAALESHARQLMVSPHRISDAHQPAGHVRVTVETQNIGSQPLYEVFLHARSRFLQAPAIAFTHQLAPGEKLVLDEVVPAAADPYPVNQSDRLQVDAGFRDAAGYSWQRWADGTLRPPVDARPIRGWRGLLVRVPPVGHLVSRWRGRESRPSLRETRPSGRPGHKR